MVARTCAWLRASSLGACTCAYAQLCASSWSRLYICRCAVVRFVAASLVHMQMHGCALRLGVHAHVQMHGCAIRRRTACTYADARLCASSRSRLHICRCTAVRFVAGSLVHMQMHGCALRRWIARTYAYARLRAPSHGARMADGAHIKARHFDRLGLVHAARKLALKSLSAQFVTGLTAPAGMRTTHGGMIRIPHRMINTPCCASAKFRRARMTASAVCSAPPGAAIQVT